MQTYLISDTHWGHKNIIQYANRPFSSVEEMDETIRNNIKAVVTDNDLVIHLGDVAFSKNPDKYMHDLPGTWVLIKGNHDSKHIMKYRKWTTVVDSHVSNGIAFSHYPDISVTSVPLIHGHIHHLNTGRPNHYNVSVEQTDYKPILLKDVLNGKLQANTRSLV